MRQQRVRSFVCRAGVPHRCVLLTLVVVASATCTSSGDQKGPAAALVEGAGPMAAFDRLVGGEWMVTFASGATAFQAWQWGPGRHSLRKISRGLDGIAEAWAGDVLYWHPGQEQVCLLSLHGDIPGIGRGVGDGTMEFRGETLHGRLDLRQPRGLRTLASRWAFHGSDRYHDMLLEDSGRGFEPLAEWDFVRVPVRAGAATPAAPAAGQRPKPTGSLQPLADFVDQIWEAEASRTATGDVSRIRSTVDWIPSLEVVCVRTVSPTPGTDEPVPVLDVYLHLPIGAGALRCLALSGSGGVYRGEATSVGDGALQFDLDGWEGDRVVRCVARLDVEPDGAVRQHVWSLQGSQRTVLLDVRHRRRDPAKPRGA